MALLERKSTLSHTCPLLNFSLFINPNMIQCLKHCKLFPYKPLSGRTLLSLFFFLIIFPLNHLLPTKKKVIMERKLLGDMKDIRIFFFF